MRTVDRHIKIAGQVKQWLLCVGLIFYLFLALKSIAQEENHFSTDPELFFSEMAKLLQQTPNRARQQDARQLFRELESWWTGSQFALNDKRTIMQTAEIMQNHKLRAYPDFYSYFHLINLFGKAGLSTSSMNAWHKHATSILESENQTKFRENLQFIRQFLTSQRLGGDNSLGWFARNATFRFLYDTTFKIRFTSLDLVCASRHDSTTITRTRGDFIYEHMLWSGREGRLYWSRFGFDPKKVYADLRFYQLDVTRTEFNADSVVFRNTYYLNMPVIGQLWEKVTSGPPSSRTSYPRFESYFRDYFIENIFKNIDFEGGINMEGPSFVGRGSDHKLASLSFRYKDQLIGTARCRALIITGDRLVSDRAAFSFYHENDSIFHPGLWLSYTEENRNLILSRSERGIQDSPFFSFHHQVNIYVEALYWNIDSKHITFRRMEGPGDESNARFESMNYFSEPEFARLQIIDEIHPMYILQDFRSQYNNTTLIRVADLAYFMKKPEEQVVNQLLRFAASGYLIYDPLTRTALLTDRFDHILQSKSGMADHDIIRLNSTTTARTPNAVLDIESFIMEIYGVSDITLSNRRSVEIYPENDQITLQKNRDFHFNGHVKAGLFNFYTLEGNFVYDTFKIRLPHIDSMVFYVKHHEQQHRDMIRLEKVKNTLTELNGSLYIDDASNKSGRNLLTSFPTFRSHYESYVFFENSKIQNGKLKREDFYFVVDPFLIDSLDNPNGTRWKFNGHLISAGIFPVFGDSLMVMDDYSLGFDHNVPKEGYAMYGNGGKYYNNIHLSNKGFYGDGKIRYHTATAESEKFSFYPDAVRGRLDTLIMTAARGAVEYPKAFGNQLDFYWFSDTNFIKLKTIKSPLTLFDSTEFAGEIELSPSQMKGSGKLRFANATLTSDEFEFKSRTLIAEYADFRLLTTADRQDAFLAKNYNAHIDFSNNIGKFVHIDAASELSFPFNQYICTLDEAIWLIDDDLVRLNNNRVRDNFGLDTLNYDQLIDLDLSGSEFTSLHPDQDSLSFFSLEAEYDIKEYAIRAKDVKILRIADAAIFPSDGLITIYENARVEPLSQATIIADTLTRLHRISAANVELISKNSYKGNGYYDYIDKENNLQTIEFQEIKVEESRTVAYGEIADSLVFMLDPHFAFAGKVSLKSDRKMLEFNGGYRVINPCTSAEHGWTAFNSLIDPENISMPINEKSTDKKGLRLYTGLYHHLADDQIYTLLQDYKLDGTDQEILSFDGVISFNPNNQSFEIVKEKKGRKDIVFSLELQRCIVKARGIMDFGLHLPHLKMNTIGEFKHLLIPDSIYVNSLISVGFPFNYELVDMMTDSILASPNPGLNLLRGNYSSTLNHILQQDEAGQIMNDIELYGSPRNVPEPFNNTLTLTDVMLKWNPATRSFVSKGTVGISNLYRNQVNKSIEAYIEIEKSRSRHSFTFYLDLGKGQWYFFTYSHGIMQALSSSAEFNSKLMSIDQPQRIVEDRQTGESYEYVISTRRRVVDFLRQMENIDL